MALFIRDMPQKPPGFAKERKGVHYYFAPTVYCRHYFYCVKVESDVVIF